MRLHKGIRRALKDILWVGVAAVLTITGTYAATRPSAAPAEKAWPAFSNLHMPTVTLPVAQYEFPQGGRDLLPRYRFVALYGAPNSPKLGSLGEQPMAETIARVKSLAATYQAHSTEPVYPCLEIIATVASASPTADGNYSREQDVASLEPWVIAAQEAGVYVVLDLQPGRSDFLTQAKQYEKLLAYPNVGLALDPEWRLTPDQVHLKQIGSVDIQEVNATVAWLAELTEAAALPQKVFLLHQFRLTMLPGREALDTSHAELAYVIQMDGNGSQPSKQNTWNTIRANAPASLYFGWKNFYDEDKPMLTESETMAVTPQPWYVSYQ